jgi:hypothetical protein
MVDRHPGECVMDMDIVVWAVAGVVGALALAVVGRAIACCVDS